MITGGNLDELSTLILLNVSIVKLISAAGSGELL